MANPNPAINSAGHSIQDGTGVTVPALATQPSSSRIWLPATTPKASFSSTAKAPANRATPDTR